MSKAPKHDELAAMSDDQLINRYNDQATHTVVGTSFYLEELARRQMAEANSRMLTLTRTMTRISWAIVLLTALNLVGVSFQIFNT